MRQILLMLLIYICGFTNVKASTNVDYIIINNKKVNIETLLPNAENMHKVCEHYGIKHPQIVTAQAVLESANFKSRIFKAKNNPFGLYNSSKKTYYSFPHWTASVKAYKLMIERKYKGGCYYVFLKKIGYASDKNYISKVKRVHNRLYL